MSFSQKFFNILTFASRFLLTFTFLLLTFSSTYSAPQTFLIDPNGGGDFKSITAAIDNLYNSLPITDEITYKIVAGVYEEQLIFDGEITGASAANTITFSSADDDASLVNIMPSSGNVMEIDNAQFLVFNKLTFNAPNNSLIVNSTNCEGYLTFTDNIFNGSSSGSGNIINLTSTASHSLDEINISGNIFNNGYDGVNLTSVNAGQNLNISNNTFSTTNRAIVLTNFDAPIISGNNITNNGIDFSMWLEDNINYIIENNKINTTTDLGSGLYIHNQNSGSINDYGTIVNNFIQAGNNGIYLNELVSVDIYFNTINIENFPLSTKSNSYALYSTSSDLNIKNNIFYNKREGKSILYQNSTSNQSDYNVFYTNGTILGNYGITTFTSLEELQTQSGMDNNSFNIPIFFTSYSNLHVVAAAEPIIGTLISGITRDIDGDLRNNPPLIGADETNSYVTALAGVYTIGSGGDFQTINDAVDELYAIGINGAVTFNILTGMYNEQINLNGTISGSSSTNMVTFQSATGDSTDVTISYTASSTADNFVLRISEAQYIKINNLTLTAGGTDYARVVWLENDSNNLEFTNNIMNGYNITSGLATDEQNIIHCDGGKLNSTIFENNDINDGKYGIYFHLNSSSPRTSNLQIIGNDITSKHYCILVEFADAPKIISNNLSAEEIALSVYYCINNISVEQNIISDGGMRVYQCIGTPTKRGIVKNNFIVNNNSYLLFTLSLDVVHYIDVYNNSITNKGSVNQNTYTLVIRSSLTDNINIVNNIIYNRNEGYAINWVDGAIDLCDYNDLYTDGPTLVKHGSTDYTTLAAWQSAPENFDANSYNAEVNFVSDTDLHIVSSSQPLYGTEIPGITTDIDGDTRYNPPFIGADEPNFSGVYVNIKVFLEGPYNSNNMNTGLTLPSNSPYDGTEAPIMPMSTVDWVQVELRDKNDETNVLQAQSALLLNDGSIVNVNGGSSLHFSLQEDQYYISVKHRNHLSVMSSTAIQLNSN